MNMQGFVGVVILTLVNVVIGVVGYYIGAIDKESYGTSRYMDGLMDGYEKRKVEEMFNSIEEEEMNDYE